jgi:spermidine synthase
MLKHPGIDRIDYVEPDARFLAMLAPYMMPTARAALRHSIVRIHHQDPRIYLQRAAPSYDAIVMHGGDPITAQAKRFTAALAIWGISLSGCAGPKSGFAHVGVSLQTWCKQYL